MGYLGIVPHKEDSKKRTTENQNGYQYSGTPEKTHYVPIAGKRKPRETNQGPYADNNPSGYNPREETVERTNGIGPQETVLRRSAHGLYLRPNGPRDTHGQRDERGRKATARPNWASGGEGMELGVTD